MLHFYLNFFINLINISILQYDAFDDLKIMYNIFLYTNIKLQKHILHLYLTYDPNDAHTM